MDALKQRPELTGINTFFRPTSPQLYVEVDEAKAMSLGIPVADGYRGVRENAGRDVHRYNFHPDVLCKAARQAVDHADVVVENAASSQA